MSHKCSIEDRSVTLLSREGHYSAKLRVNSDNTCTMGSCIVVLKDECIPVPTVVGRNNRLNDLVSVVEPSDIPLVDVEFCPPSHGDPFPNHDISTSVAIVCDHGWRLVTLPSSTSTPLPFTKKS